MRNRDKRKLTSKELRSIKEKIDIKVQEQKELDLTISTVTCDMERTRLDVSEELVCGIMDDGKDMRSLLNYLITHMTKEELKIISDKLAELRYDNDLLLWSSSNASAFIPRLLLLSILTSKTELAKKCLAGIIWYMEANFYVQGDKPRVVKLHGSEFIEFDNFALESSILYAKQQGFLENVSFDVEGMEGDKYYMDYKFGTITIREFKEYLVTGGGKLPMPIDTEDDDLYTNPNYSWDGFSDTLLENEDMELESKKYIQSIFQRHYGCLRLVALKEADSVLHGAYNIIHGNKENELEKKLELIEAKYGNLDKKYKNIRSALKKNKRTKEEQYKQLAQARGELNKLKKECKALRETSVTLEQHLEDSSRYEEEMDKLIKELTDQKRMNVRQSDDIINLKEELSKLEKEKKQIENEYAKYKESSTSTIFSIPLDCIVNSLKDTKIALIGGDVVHSKIRALGLNEIKLIETDRRVVYTNEIANVNLVVFMTSYISHSFMEMPKQYALNNNIPILYFNGRNIETLCNEMFIALNGE